MSPILHLPIKIKNLFLQALSLIAKNPILLILALAVSFSTNLISPRSEVVATLIFLIFWVGWSGTEIELIERIYLKQPVNWNELIPITFKYLRKMLPTILGIILIIVIVVPSVIALSVILVIGPVIVYSITQLHAYLADYAMIDFAIKTMAIYLSGLISVYITQTLVLMVVSQENLFKSLLATKTYFIKNLNLFLLLAVVVAGVNLVVWQLPILIIKLVSTLRFLILNTMILLHHLQTDKKSVAV